MNKFLKYLSVAAALLIATSCSKDDDSNATITPGINNTPAVEENHAPKPVPFTITVGGKSASLSKAKVVEGEDNSLTQQFTEGDVLIITGEGLDKSKQSILTFSSEDVDNGTAIFTGDLYPASESSLVSGVTTLTATLSTESLNNKGKSLEAPELSSTLDEAFKQYGYLVADFIYDAGASEISLEQHTAFIVFNLPYSGAKVDVTIEGNTTTVYVSKQQVLAVPDGATVYSKSLDVDKTINLDYKNSSEAVVVVFDCKRDKDLLPDNCIPGLFSVSADKQVFFSKGNLQATFNGTEWSWGFAPSQTSYIGDDDANTSINGDGSVSEYGTVDLFGWVGASNKTWSGAAMHGISNSTTTNSVDGYGTGKNESLKSDWGNVFGENSPWRTLTGGGDKNAEWYYLFNSRTDADKKYGLGSIVSDEGTVNGLILLPDGWTYPTNLSPSSTSKDYFTSGTSDWSNTYTVADWTNMEANGAVFLPAAGYRNGTDVVGVGFLGVYWSSSAYDENRAWVLVFYSGNVGPDFGGRILGQSVRLVRPL